MPVISNTATAKVFRGSQEISHIYRGSTLLWEKPSTWSPVSLFDSGEQGGLYVTSWAGSMFLEDTLTTPAGVGDTLGGLVDFSGNGNHALQRDSTRRPTIVDDSGRVGLLFNNTRDVLQHPGVVVGQTPEFEVSVCYIPNDPGNWMLMNSYLKPNPWWIAAQKGSGTTSISGTIDGTFEALYFDNSLWNGSTRGEIYSASQIANRLFFQGTNAKPVNSFGLFKYSSSSYTAPGIVLGILIREGRMSEAQRQNLDDFWYSLL